MKTTTASLAALMICMAPAAVAQQAMDAQAVFDQAYHHISPSCRKLDTPSRPTIR